MEHVTICHGACHNNYDMTRAARKGMILSRGRMTLIHSRNWNYAPLPRVKHGLALLSLLLLDRLASEVVRFNRAYAPGFVCIPSRTLFMLGLNNRHFGADRFKR